MLSSERKQAIGQVIAQSGELSVQDLARQFEVSPSTIRRDLAKLEENGAIRRVHGGARLSQMAESTRGLDGVGVGTSRIGRAAANRVLSGETIYLGPGRLTLEVAKALAPQSDLTLVTNSLKIADWFANHSRARMVVTGGTVDRFRDGLHGPLVIDALKSLRADRVIIEASGLRADQGVMASDLVQAEVYRALFKTPAESIVLVSSGRLGKVGGVFIDRASEIDVIITNREAQAATIWDLSEMGILVVSV